MMQGGLEERIGGAAQDRFRSRGERHIAATLNKYGIPFLYEPRVAVNDNGKRRELRPDFYLPEFNLYVEFYGRVGNEDYDIRTARKKTIYAANNLNVVSVYPWHLVQDWPNYLFKHLPAGTSQRLQTSPIRRSDSRRLQLNYRRTSPSRSYSGSPRKAYR